MERNKISHVMLSVSEIISDRIVKRLTKAQKKVRTPTVFYLVEMDGDIQCLWCQNVKKSQRKIVKITNPQRGFTYDEWIDITLRLINGSSIISSKFN